MTTSLKRWWFAHVAISIGGFATGCWPERDGADGTCVIEPRSVVDCRVTGYTDELQTPDLVGYSCTGSERPDIDAITDEGVPEGLLCADKGPLDGSDDETYCCTEELTTCAYDPVAECDPDTHGFQCWGNNRPESLNPSIKCTNGTQENDGLVKYCCSGRLEPSKCEESAVAGCGDRLKGFLCEGEGRPRGEDLRQNQSRADYYYPTCTIPKQAPNPAYYTYCCYMPAKVQLGGTCINQVNVPGCEPGRWGFACYGPDHPSDNFAPMECPDPGFPGRTSEGWEATLYCCDFK
jgi:hypothetical protein